MPNLTNLILSDNHIQDISELEKFPNLIEIGLLFNDVNDISILSKLTKLTTVALASNRVQNIDALKNLKKMNMLLIQDNEISNLPNLTDLMNLEVKYTDVSNNRITETMLKKNLPSKFSSNKEWIQKNKYVPAVTGLETRAAGKNKVVVRWNPSDGAEGYIIYRHIGKGKFQYRYMLKGTSFTDTSVSNNDYNFYRIYPYYVSVK